MLCDVGYLSSLAPSEAFPVARRYAAKALELDKSLAEAHASLGFVKLYFDWDWADAEANFQRAIALDPSYAPSREWYSIFLLAAGRPEDGFREIQLARQPDPLSLPVNTDLGFHYYYTGRYSEAVKQLNFVLELNKDFPPAHLWLGRTYQELGRLNDALAEFQRVEEKLPEWPVSIAARGFVAGVAGCTDEAQNTLTELRRLAGKKFVTSYGVALVHAGLGQKDSAFAWLNKAFDERSHWLVWLRLDPRWKELRSDPRFEELVRRVETARFRNTHGLPLWVKSGKAQTEQCFPVCVSKQTHGLLRVHAIAQRKAARSMGEEPLPPAPLDLDAIEDDYELREDRSSSSTDSGDSCSSPRSSNAAICINTTSVAARADAPSRSIPFRLPLRVRARLPLH